MKLPLTTSSPTGLGYVFLGMMLLVLIACGEETPPAASQEPTVTTVPATQVVAPTPNECGGSNANRHATAGANGNCRAHRHPGADGYARAHRRPGADGNTRPTAHGNAPSGADARSVGT